MKSESERIGLSYGVSPVWYPGYKTINCSRSHQENSACTIQRLILESQSHNNYVIENLLRPIKSAIYANVYKAYGIKKKLVVGSNATTASPSLSTSNLTDHHRQFEYYSPQREYCVKMYLKSQISSTLFKVGTENPWNEMAAMSFIRDHTEAVPRQHPNIIKLHEICQDEVAIYMIMDFVGVGQDMCDIMLESMGMLSETAIRRYFLQIVSGVKHLHHVFNICHRDLSLENILLSNADSRCVIIDFGLSLKIQSRVGVDNDDSAHLMSFVSADGKPQYKPPEIHNQLVPFDPFKCDVWALGNIPLL